MIQEQLKKALPVLAAVIFISVLFFPSIRLGGSLPKIEIVDLLLPFITLFVVYRRKEIVNKNIIYILLGFSAYILLSMGINGRLAELRDYFEIFKLFKIIILLVLFSLSGAAETVKKLIKPAFAGLVVVNLVHYFNLFQINEFLDQFFMGGGRYSIFGLDSAGHLTFKRMIGLLGNPNDNAIVFMIFSIFFFPRKEVNLKSLAWFLTALIMMFLCQSRTALFALVPMLIVYALLIRKNLPLVLATFAISCLSFFIAFAITKNTVHVGIPSKYAVYGDSADSTFTAAGTTYLESVVGGNLVQSQSVQGRLDTWKHLWRMIEKKPIFGHAPYKEYFYNSHLYAESEYILIIWRYGFIGLTIYLAFLIILLIQSIKGRKLEYGSKLLLFLVLLLVTGLTNVPFGNKTIFVLLAIMIGLFYNELKSGNAENENEPSISKKDE
ncbi:O-antigen ligase family protein [Crocinitomix catalasitica]|nr:O-antigen ligase family protein [Crocinitomix catalasitica]